ncbi:MAG: endonuclease V [Thermoplasmata archaeon]|nr:endonuclease V [Thermoplasmata archaeon]
MRWKSVENLPDMMRETYDLVAQVPTGKVTTYGEVARALGDVVASRFVGLAMSMNDDIVRVPCRRVVQSDGHLGGYTGGGPSKKARLLKGEGIEVSQGKIIGLERYMFSDFRTRYPLRDLRKRQRILRRGLRLARFSGSIERVAGVDVAYRENHAFVALVTFDAESLCEIDRVVVEGDATFPYIPTYLAFRELPLMRSVSEFIDRQTVLIYDGNGIMHPEGFGIASQLGVVLGVPTIGVAKKLLCGQVSSKGFSAEKQVTIGGRLRGYALSSTPGAKAVYVSPGHMLSVDQSKDIVSRFLVHRVPEPTRLAHIAAESARRGTNKK